MVFASLSDKYLPAAEREQFLNMTRDVLEPLYKKVGWNASSERSWDERSLQSTVLLYAVYFDVKPATDDAQQYLEHFLDECFESGTHRNISSCDSLHVDVRQAVYCAAFKSGDNDTISLVMQYLKHYEEDPILGYLEPQVDQFGAAKCLPESPPTKSKRVLGRHEDNVLRFPAGASFGHGNVQRI